MGKDDEALEEQERLHRQRARDPKFNQRRSKYVKPVSVDGVIKATGPLMKKRFKGYSVNRDILSEILAGISYAFDNIDDRARLARIGSNIFVPIVFRKPFSKGNAFAGLLILRDFLLDSGHNLPADKALDLIKFATSNLDDPNLTIMIEGYLKENLTKFT